MSSISFPTDIPKDHPYNLCKHFNGNDKLMGYLTYIAYKDYKLAKIQQYKNEHNNKEPSKQVLNQFKTALIESDYESFIAKANELKIELFKPLVLEAVKEQLPKEVAKTNYENIKKMLKVCASSDIDISVGNAVHEIHDATTHKCKSFWSGVLASAVGALALAVMIIIINLLLQGGLFQLCVPSVTPYGFTTIQY